MAEEKDLMQAGPVPRRVMPLIYVIDTSGSMEGNKIGAVNDAIRNVMNEIGTISKQNADAKIKVGILQFDTEAKWMYDTGLISAEEYQYKDLEAVGLTNFGEACKELNSKLSKSKGWMNEPTGMRAAAILLMSDGEPTSDYVHELDKLKGNPWFMSATKLALAIGNPADKKMLLDFTGSAEAIMTVNNIDSLIRMIKTISITASKVNSQSASVGTTTTPEGEKVPESVEVETINKIKDTIKDDPTLDVHRGTDSSGKEDNWDWPEGWS